MEALDKELKEIIEIHTLLSGEYAKCPLSVKDLKFHAGAFADLLRARLRQCLQNGERRTAEGLASELLALIGGIAPPLLGKLKRVIASEMRLFRREWNVQHPPRPRELSKSEAYEKMMRSLGPSR